jgi:hypothetical protein
MLKQISHVIHKGISVTNGVQLQTSLHSYASVFFLELMKNGWFKQRRLILFSKMWVYFIVLKKLRIIWLG